MRWCGELRKQRLRHDVKWNPIFSRLGSQAGNWLTLPLFSPPPPPPLLLPPPSLPPLPNPYLTPFIIFRVVLLACRALALGGMTYWVQFSSPTSLPDPVATGLSLAFFFLLPPLSFPPPVRASLLFANISHVVIAWSVCDDTWQQAAEEANLFYSSAFTESDVYVSDRRKAVGKKRCMFFSWQIFLVPFNTPFNTFVPFNTPFNTFVTSREEFARNLEKKAKLKVWLARKAVCGTNSCFITRAWYLQRICEQRSKANVSSETTNTVCLKHVGRIFSILGW